MTDDPELDPIERLADNVGALVDRIDHQTAALSVATEAMRRHRRNTWLAVTAVIALVLAVTGAGWREIDYRDQQRRESCQRGNEIREGVVRASAVAVEEAALELAGDDPVDQGEARAVAHRVAARVADDPGLRLREC
jgi:hypothetical protein